MMAIDASFLLEFLQIYAVNEDNTLQRLLSTMPHLIDSIGRTSHNMLLHDIIMLENQIPLFILQAILEVQCSSSQIGDEVLHSMLVGFLKDLSPLKIIESSSCINLTEYSHLLEFFYYNIVPKIEDQIEYNEEIDHDVKSHESVSCVKHFFGATRDFISRQTRAFVFGVIMFLVQLLWRVIKSLPILLILTQSIKNLLSFEVNQNSKPYNGSSSSANTASPLLEEIMIPSVTELTNAGIKFYPTDGDISTIEFNTRTATFHLPVIRLDVNSEVVLRNLVAYEASVGSRPLVLSRYIELMNGIIDTMEDAKLLREEGIVLNYLKSDQEVAELWNGMTRSIRLTRVRAFDKVIDDVNNYYCSRWRIKIRRFLKRYVVDSWECLVFLAILSFFLVICIQTFCVSYGCTPSSHDKKR